MSAYTDRLRQIAEEEGMPWDVVSRVINAEGGMTDPFRQAEAILKKTGRREQSWGPLQLNIEGGVGEKAIKAGYDPRKDWEGAYRIGLRHAKEFGWGDWMGARKIGLAGPGKGSSGKRHVGGAGSSPKYFDTEAGGYEAPKPATGGQYTLEPEGKGKKDPWNKQAGDALAEVGKGFKSEGFLPSGQPPVQFTGGDAMPSVMRMPFQPTQVQAGGGLGGGGDIRQLLAQLMAQGGYG